MGVNPEVDVEVAVEEVPPNKLGAAEDVVAVVEVAFAPEIGGTGAVVAGFTASS
jgi:hypothetical protein